MLVPVLFIIYICDLFILNDGLEFGRYANDTTPFVVYGENWTNTLWIRKTSGWDFLMVFK